ncbi:YjjG family noncanonical pyrimidine nucleotidase [Soonwooa sp.]|uniref:YjjG family noncanonical pyrimidine nucleotidase n=1 Tax=Soonwooa sp. TaxID=1938592 RepID=UPI0026287F84|nr:YjjG family noncanonical pyrimidine nucleotidase [Soonwooa sp.]
MEKIRHIFFDLDNTLWDHRKNAYLTIKDLFVKMQISEKYNIEFESFHKVYDRINEDLWELIRDGKIDKEHLRKHRFYDTFLEFGVDDLELAQYFETHFLDQILSYNDLVDGAEDLLKYLKAKQYKLHIISNGFQEVTERKCILSGINKYFETITSADSVGKRKPNPEVYKFALNEAKACIEESLMIGDDWIADVVGATNFGLQTIFFDALNENIDYPLKVRTIYKLNELQNLI